MIWREHRSRPTHPAVLHGIAALIALGGAGGASAALNDVFPTDYVPMAPGTTVLVSYLYDRQVKGPYVGGEKTQNWKGNATIGALRASYFGDVLGVRTAGTLTMTYADQHLDGTGIPNSINKASSGWYDARLGLTGWAINDPERRHYLAVNLTAMVPTGEYQRQNLQNVGENRHREALSLAWIRGLGTNWTAEAIGELTWYGDNSAYFPGARTRQQARSEALTTYLRYRWDNGFQAFAGYQWNTGGESRINRVDQHDSPRSQRAYLGLLYPVAKNHVLSLRLGKDVQVENGFAIDREATLRWLVYF
ncbi:transporter [Oryzomicrobium sp.]|uniref:transporter n=1 Tax=Oryzomicrobium sp. TaxID=1911578 RepID=UPI0026001CD8|nr:transporter [Oryzomicrobium sp.]MCE1244376.1 transporter [Oryzomicrobium sp.]